MTTLMLLENAATRELSILDYSKSLGAISFIETTLPLFVSI